MKEEFIGSFDQRKQFRIKVFLVFTLQTLVSAILAVCCYSIPAFSVACGVNGFSLAVGLYAAAVATFALVRQLRKEPQNFILIIIVALSSNLFDTCLVGIYSEPALLVFCYLFTSMLGLLVYFYFTEEEFTSIHAIFYSVLSNTLMLLVLILLGFKDVLIQSMSFWASVCYASFLVFCVTDITSRYKIKVSEYYNGALYLYLDILITPYILTKAKFLLS